MATPSPFMTFLFFLLAIHSLNYLSKKVSSSININLLLIKTSLLLRLPYLPFVNIFSIIFGSVNYFENVVCWQENVSELLLNFICVFLIPEYDGVTLPNFELGSHLYFTCTVLDKTFVASVTVIS